MNAQGHLTMDRQSWGTRQRMRSLRFHPLITHLQTQLATLGAATECAAALITPCKSTWLREVIDFRTVVSTQKEESQSNHFVLHILL